MAANFPNCTYRVIEIGNIKTHKKTRPLNLTTGASPGRRTKPRSLQELNYAVHLCKEMETQTKKKQYWLELLNFTYHTTNHVLLELFESEKKNV